MSDRIEAEILDVLGEEVAAAVDTPLVVIEGTKGDPGKNGKSAYQYAVEGGYTGTEAEFAEKLAEDIPAVDSTLAQSGQAADAAAVGDRLSALSEEIASVKIISYTQFGAALDGVSDDTEAAIACHQYANANGCRVEQHSGTLYLKTATEENCPIVKTSCDWSGMTLKVDEHMGKNIIMKVVPDEGVQSHSLTSEEIGELAKGAVQIPFLVDYKNCICHFTTDISIGNRLNKTESYVYHETVTVDRYGNLLEGELFRAMSDATSISMEYQSIFQRPVTLEGVRIVLDTTDDSKIPCILVKRSNTTMKDWTFVIQSEVSSDSTAYKGEILKVENCYNVVIEKFSGENFGTFFSQGAEDKSETCYMVYLSGLSRFTMRDCMMIRAWGVIQSQYCKDMIFKDSTLGRIDNHYGCRNYTVNNCTITSSHSTINIGYGDGQFIIDNVRFVKFQDPDTTFQNHCILLRGEFCALYSGELIINNVTINNYSGQAINLLSGSYSDSFDFGDSAAILPLEFPEVKINNVVYDTDDVTIVNFKVTQDSYAAAQNLPIKAKLVSIENVKVKDNTTKHLRLTVNYGYLDQVTQLDHYGVRMRIPWKSDWITNVSCSILAMDSHINNFNGSIGDTLQMENCYVYSNATTWQYVRNMVLHNCHVYIGSNSTVKFNCNNSFRCTSTVFEERVQGTRFEAIQVPDLYYFKDCCCISSKLDDELASKLMDSNTITNSGILFKSENMADSYVEWSYDELSAGTEKNFAWTKYLMLLITTGNYSNIYESTLVPTSEFANTTSTHRPILCWGSSKCDVYQVDENTIYAMASSISGNQRLRVYGLIQLPR